MRLYQLLFSVLALLAITACGPEETEKKVYPEITTLEGTIWNSYDAKSDIYYDIYYNVNGQGQMLGYDTAERNEGDVIVDRAFAYSYTRAIGNADALVDVQFEDGQCYGGILVPKGNFKVNNKDVYLIQLYELTAAGGDVAYDDKGNFKSVLQMWME